MQNIKISAALAVRALAWVLVADVVIVLFMALQISAGAPTPHIPFWDFQLRALLSW